SAIAGTATGVFLAPANCLGRIGWGMISDFIGRKLSLLLMCVIQGVAMLAFYFMGFHPALLYLGAALIGFNFGGNFALFPAITADFFGSKRIAANYACIFTAYGVGGIIGPVLGGYFKDQGEDAGVGVWTTPLIIAGIACLAAAAIALMLKPPRSRAESTV
ncbi:MAG: MFS transporter, partial [Ponticaulis sp.]|nr:MFS transporter [Ponticaulis sp.]